MSVTEKTQEDITKKEEVKEEIRYRIRPTRYISYDAEKKTWEIEIHVPGVKKENVHIKILDDAYFFEARRDQALYSLSEYFPFDIEKDSVKAVYENGLLKITGNIHDPMSDAFEIKLD